MRLIGKQRVGRDPPPPFRAPERCGFDPAGGNATSL